MWQHWFARQKHASTHTSQPQATSPQRKFVPHTTLTHTHSGGTTTHQQCWRTGSSCGPNSTILCATGKRVCVSRLARVLAQLHTSLAHQHTQAHATRATTPRALSRTGDRPQEVGTEVEIGGCTTRQWVVVEDQEETATRGMCGCVRIASGSHCRSTRAHTQAQDSTTRNIASSHTLIPHTPRSQHTHSGGTENAPPGLAHQ